MFDIVPVDFDKPVHRDAVLALMKHYALDPMGGGEALSTYAQQNLVAELRRRDDVFSVLAFKGEQAAGLVNCFEGFSTFQARPLMNIHDVVVHQRFRGQGLAGLMLQQVERQARLRGCCKLTLEVLQGNELAQAVYRKAGFLAYQLDPKMGQAMFWEKKL